MNWWRWRTRQEEAKRLLERSDDVRRRSERLRRELLDTTAELDEFVAALNAEVRRQTREGQ